MLAAALADGVPRDERENDGKDVGDGTENGEEADDAGLVGRQDVAEDEDAFEDCSVEVRLVRRESSKGMGVYIPREEVRFWEEVRIEVAVVVVAGRHWARCHFRSCHSVGVTEVPATMMVWVPEQLDDANDENDARGGGADAEDMDNPSEENNWEVDDSLEAHS